MTTTTTFLLYHKLVTSDAVVCSETKTQQPFHIRFNGEDDRRLLKVLYNESSKATTNT